MSDFLQRLKQHKLVQWAVAYVAFAFALIQVLGAVAGSYRWPDAVMHIAFGVLALGFVVLLVVAWYHGERGAQRISGPELLLIALVLAVGGGLSWHYANTPAQTGAASAMASASGTRPNHGAPADKTPPVATKTAMPAASSIAAPSIPAQSVAVLPFENLSTDKANAYFADGMQDLILTKLADIGDLKVISRTSTMKYASHPDDLKTIGRQLGVAAILEGSVQKAGNQVLINVQLIDANTDSHLWAQSYTRTLDNIFGVEGDVAEKVAAALKAKLSPTQSLALAVAPTRNPQAYDAYLRAKHYQDIDSDSLSGGPKAIASFKQAVALDPKFALAWADLAWAQYWAYREVRQPATLRDAQKNAHHALELAPDLPEAHIAMSVIDLYGLRDIKDARAHAQRALELRPNYAYAYRLLGDVDQSQGDFAAGATQMQHALALKPNDHVLADLVGMAQGLVGNYAGARRALHQALAIAPRDQFAYLTLSQVELLDSGDIDAALKVLDALPADGPKSADVTAWRVRLLLMQRDYATARQVVAGLPDASGEEKVAVTHLRAEIEYAAGGLDKARPYLLKLDARSGRLQHNPDMRGRPDFHSNWALVLAKLGRKNEAMRQMDIARHLAAKGRVNRMLRLYPLAAVQVIVGENNAAIATLQKFMAMPGHQLELSPAMLKVDPTWDPIRKDPRFQALLKKYAHAEPAPASSEIGHD